MLTFALSHRSGQHAEDARAEATAAEEGVDEGGQRGGKKTKREEFVSRYMQIDEAHPSEELPMMLIGYEELYNSERSEVVAIRVWKLVRLRIYSNTTSQTFSYEVVRPLRHRYSTNFTPIRTSSTG